MKHAKRLLVPLVLWLSLATGAARASMPVIDIAALQQLVQQVDAWQQQLRAMQQQLSQLRQTRDALTGVRGMEQLLRQTPAARNYLPPDWAALTSAVQSSAGTYAGVAAAIRGQISANSVLTLRELRRVDGSVGTRLAAERAAVATGQTLARAAFARSSARFGELSALIDKIGATPDAKAIAELQGRIGAEQAMLVNEGLKLAALGQAIEAERWLQDLQRREAITQNHGAFASRFQPTPPAP